MQDKLKLKELLQPSPQYSVAVDLDDLEKSVFKIDDGKYRGTVYSYNDFGEIEEQADKSGLLTYSCSIKLFFIDDELLESPDEIFVDEFYKTISSPIILNILLDRCISDIEQEEKHSL